MGQQGDKGAVIVPKSSKSDIDGFLEAAAKLPAAAEFWAREADLRP